ncbi:replication initiator protein A [Candidatus Fukatsuia symbiotica]|uniref:RepB family plasmid replication initiator protein n=1 Tax=Candidatus Fukatsuia symbiotica TaxID=1878942 RepID=A0A2U8I9D7_9GAMM|nr:replication initiator protein A [Candidatus Fukatsuia symbiotica]AWK15668.1 RepB family plasmid replication initiator protein [Candidatus Fukatsuia symbiotica]AWK15676.1 RepB family plasmid replication initiator protein [Candidatus Fukatsuia symbiotica]MEA9446318.1 replication initiator protein A [Candidatus Fukatsuia symbiotica]
MADGTEKNRVRNLKTLRPRKHQQIDFFIADEVDIVNFRDELASMEHPFFALKGGDTRTREYVNGNTIIKVAPNAEYGMATIFDKDVWIYAISKLCQAMYKDQPISRTVCFTAYDLFVTTNRNKSGRSYKELEKALDRLAGTRITTNIQHSVDKREAIGFGLIDSWHVVEEQKGKQAVGMIEVTLPNWLYEAITRTKLLKISQDYFRIRKAIDRRLYEIARKHCGSQHQFQISLEKLHIKTGSTRDLRKFRMDIKNLSKINDLPDYEIRYEAGKDCVIFTNRDQDSEAAQKSKLREGGKKAIFGLKKKYGFE